MPTHDDDDVLPPRINGMPRSVNPRKGAPDPDTLPVGERDAYGRTCRVCGAGFTTTNPRWETCSYACSRVWPEYMAKKPSPTIPHEWTPFTSDPDRCAVMYCDLLRENHPSTVLVAGHALVGCDDEDECPLVTPCHFVDADGNMTCKLDYDQHPEPRE